MESTATSSDLLQKQAEARVDGWIGHVTHSVKHMLIAVRLLLFLLYLITAIVSFWLWVLATAFLLVRLTVLAASVLLLWLSGGLAPPPEGMTSVGQAAHELRVWWRSRYGSYALFVQPAASHYLVAHRAARRFWHWSIPRKMFTLMLAAAFVVLPALYIVPRPQYIQLLDDNAIDYHEGNVQYLVHGVDLFERGQTREYSNDRVWWLGKINPQGLKNRLYPGRFYKLWVVGIRWYWLPTLYPTIVSATEVDSQGKTLAEPSHFIPATTTGR